MADRSPLVALGALNAAIAVAAGAFAAHALEDRLDAHHLDVFETAARYHMYHALGMGLCAVAGVRRAGWLMQAGAAIFAGTLYALALSGVKVLGAITPIGGLLMMLGWADLAITCRRRTPSPR